MNISWTYPLPFRFQSTAASALLAGWELGGITTISSGRPLTVRVGFDHDHNVDGGTGDRPDLLPGMSQNPVSGVTRGCAGIQAGERLGTPDRWYDPCAFRLPEEGLFGNLGRNTRSARMDQAARHRSLTRCLDWSYKLLEPWVQDGFAKACRFNNRKITDLQRLMMAMDNVWGKARYWDAGKQESEASIN